MVATTFDGHTATDVLAPADQAVFALQRATGISGATQYIWTYDHHIDFEGLRRFHRNLRAGRLSRRIRRSALPFGPPRWICGHDVAPYLRIGSPLPAAAARSWLDEQARVSLDPEHGPAWRLAVLPLTDGGAVVSLLVSRCIADGGGLKLAVTEAIAGWNDDHCGAATRSHRPARVLFSDIGATARRLPAISRASRTASRTAEHQPVPTPDTSEESAPLELPTATICIDAGAWDRRAEALGGSPATMMAALAADVARRLGRSVDGTVDLRLAVNERVSSDDTRANAVDNVDISVGPHEDLAAIRADFKQVLRSHRDIHDPQAEFPPLPPRVIRKAPFVAVGGLRTVISDNLGEGDSVVAMPDGTHAATVYVRSLYPGATKATLDSIGGVLTLTFDRNPDRVFVSVVSYQPGQQNSHDALHRIINEALEALGVTGSAIQEVPTC